nr:AI-2E family transporter [Propionibacterium sp.]
MDSTAPHTGWPKILTVLLIWCAFAGVLVALHASADLVGPLFAALNLVIAAWPVRTALLRRGAPRLVATVTLGLVVFVVLGLAIFVLYWGVSSLVRELPDYQDQFTRMYAEIVAFAATFGISQDQMMDQLKQISPSSIAGWVTSAVSGLSGIVVAVGVLAVMIFLLVLDSSGYEQRTRALAAHRPNVAVALAEFTAGVRRYWVVTSVFGLIVAVLDVVVLLVLGVPLALVWGIISFLTNYIPNVGFVIGIIPPALMALLANGPTAALAVVVAYSVINFVIQSVIQPKFNGDAVGVTALVSFLSLLLWSAVLGPIGALLGLPATLFFKALLVDTDPSTRWFNAFIASDPVTSHPLDRGSIRHAEEAVVAAAAELDLAEHEDAAAPRPAAAAVPVKAPGRPHPRTDPAG